MDFIVLSYYTKNTEYERSVRTLRESLIRFDLPYFIEGIDSLGTWDKNTRYKAKMIRKMMDWYQDKDIVFVDCDAMMLSYPGLFHAIDEDMAVHYFKGYQLASGTLFFKNNDMARAVIDSWIRRNDEDRSKLEQQNLQDAVEEYKRKGLKILNLPPHYCKIFDLMPMIEHPVIEHYQLSRSARTEISIYAYEKNKYAEQWQRDYSQSACAVPLAKYVDIMMHQFEQPDKLRLLDVGCGDGTTVKILRRLGYDCDGVDITLAGHKGSMDGFYEAPIWNMPFKDNEYDITFSTDVLEHLPAPMLERSITEIFRISKISTFHCIATFSHILNDREMHLSIHNIAHWDDMFDHINTFNKAYKVMDRKDFMQIEEIQPKGGEII